MCDALTQIGQKVVLYGRKGQDFGLDLSGFYSLRTAFEVRQIRVPNILKIRRIIFALIILFQLRQERQPFRIIGRDYFLMGFYAKFRLLPGSYCLEIHQPPANHLQFLLQKWIFEHARFEKLIVISHALKEEYLRRFGELVSGKILVAHDGADAYQLPESLAPPRKYSAIHSPPRIGYIGSFYPGKGIEMILTLAPRLPEYDFHVVGGTPTELSRWTAQKLSPNLRFHGFVPPAHIYTHMANCDILLAPFMDAVLVGRKGGDIVRWMSPLKVFEYMSAGVPMICTDLPVLREVLTDQVNCLLAQVNDPEDWEKKIRLLIEKPSLRETIGRQAQQDFFAQYTWEKRAYKLMNDIPVQAE